MKLLKVSSYRLAELAIIETIMSTSTAGQDKHGKNLSGVEEIKRVERHHREQLDQDVV